MSVLTVPEDPGEPGSSERRSVPLEQRLEELLRAERSARRDADRAKRRLSFLLRANTLLAGSLHLDESLRRLAELAVTELCDVCLVDLAEEDGVIRRVAAVHADPALQPLVDLVRDRYSPRRGGANPAAKAIASGRSELIELIDEAYVRGVTVDEEHASITRRLAYRSAIAVPLLGRTDVLGAMTLIASDRSGRRYGPGDLALAEDLAHRVGTLLDNVRLYERERHTLDVLQRSLLPPAMPVIPGMEAAARFHPAGAGTEVGGDFYDLFPIGWGSWGVIVGDVCGKGPEAAAASAQVRHGLRALAAPELAPSATLARLNDVVIRSGNDRFSTLVYGRLDPGSDGSNFVLARAGHPLPMILRTGGSVELVENAGTVIGVFPGARYEDRAISLEPGEALVLYTDGVIEQARGEGIPWLKYLVASCRGLDAEGIASRIEHAVLSSQVREDDVAILVLRARPAAQGSDRT